MDWSKFVPLLRLAFWVALVTAFVMATLPNPPELLSNDKSQHMLAFLTLAVVAALAYPRARIGWLAILLAGFGALIEFVQMIPALHRSADVLDWLADVVALLVGLAIASWLRRRLSLS